MRATYDMLDLKKKICPRSKAEGNILSEEKKEEIWLSPMTKAPKPTEMPIGQSHNTNNATKKFDYTAVADQLRTASLSNYTATQLVWLTWFTGPTFPLPATAV